MKTVTIFSAVWAGFCDRFVCIQRNKYCKKVVKTLKSSGIGGQAVIEGVMMKNKDKYAVAVRTPDGEIVVDKQHYQSFSETHSWAKLPLVRGVVAFVESLSIGMKTLTYSAGFYEEEEEETESKVERALSNVFKEKAEAVVMALTVIFAIVMAIGLFMFLPWFIAEKAGALIDNTILQALVEGALRLIIFILYVFAISLTKDIKRVYMYHGAEHKTINCVEQGLELTVENVKAQSREHKRCGTSFLLYVMIISIIFFMFIRVDNVALRIVLRVVLIPVVAGVSYEFIRFAGNSDNKIVNILSRPGFWMQGLTTREPEDKMIEVAIASVEAVFDWRGYIEAVKNGTVDAFLNKKESPMVAMEPVKEEETKSDTSEKRKTNTTETPRVAAVKRADHTVRRGQYFRQPKREQVDLKEKEDTTERPLETKEKVSKEKSVANVHQVATLKKASGTRRPMQPIEELRRDSILLDSVQEDEDDEILSALDKFFE